MTGYNAAKPVKGLSVTVWLAPSALKVNVRAGEAVINAPAVTGRPNGSKSVVAVPLKVSPDSNEMENA